MNPAQGDPGSTIPLVLAFFLVALLMVAGSVAAGDAFVQQRDLQDVCDGAAAAAASAVDLGRGAAALPVGDLRFLNAQAAVTTYLGRDASRAGVQVQTLTSGDGQLLTLQCVRTETIAFGAVFGHADGVRHVATASVRAPLTG